MGDPGERRDFVVRIERAGLGRLRQRQHAGLRRLHQSAGVAQQGVAQRVRRDLAIEPGNADELGAAHEELGRAAFVIVNVRFLVAEHGLPGPGERGQRQRIGARAGGDEEGRHGPLENLAQQRLGALRIGVRAIGRRVDAARRDNGLENLRRDPRAVIAGEMHRNPSS